jgi:hypothetical protein
VLERAFRDFEATLYPNCRLQLRRSAPPAFAFAVLEANRIPIVLYDGDFEPGAWKEMLERLKVLPAPPCLIVVSRSARLHSHHWPARPAGAREGTKHSTGT